MIVGKIKGIVIALCDTPYLIVAIVIAFSKVLYKWQ
jgi:hypothetical protein